MIRAVPHYGLERVGYKTPGSLWRTKSRTTMRYLLFFIVAAALTSCAAGSAVVNIDAGQKFILGEFMDRPYQAKLRNQGTETITVQLVSKADGEIVKSVDIMPDAKARLAVSPDNEVHMLNKGSGPGLIAANTSVSGAEGMRYQPIDAPTKVTLPAPAESPTVKAKPAAGQQIPMRFDYAYDVEITAGGTFYFAEDQPVVYSAVIANKGSRNVDVKIRSRKNNRQTQGFGLGPYGKPQVNLNEGEVLTLVNNGNATARLKLKLNKELSGGRVR